VAEKKGGDTCNGENLIKNDKVFCFHDLVIVPYVIAACCRFSSGISGLRSCEDLRSLMRDWVFMGYKWRGALTDNMIILKIFISCDDPYLRQHTLPSAPFDGAQGAPRGQAALHVTLVTCSAPLDIAGETFGMTRTTRDGPCRDRN
jgi:hypothetical protein